MMDTLTTHPSTAQQAKAFTSPSSLSFPGGAAELTPPASEPEAYRQSHGAAAAKNAAVPTPAQSRSDQANGQTEVAPATPAATPGAGPTASGIVPTLQ